MTEAYTERFTTPGLDGVMLHAAHRGEPGRPTVILLHGGGANLHWWDHVAPALAERYRVTALDFRGHGDSDYPEERATGAFDRDAEALVEHLGSPEVALVGHSLGARVALHHAATHGGVRAVVAIEVSRGAEQRDSRRMRLALIARRTYETRAEAIERFRFLPASPNAPEVLRRAIAEQSVRHEANGRFGFKFDRHWFGVPPSPKPPLGRVACPTLIVRGAESELLTRQGAEALARELPSGRVLEVEGAGHNVHIEQAEAVTAALLDHLGEHLGSPRW